MSTQTVFKVGNSKAITLSNELGFELGDKIVVNKSSMDGEFIVRKLKKTKKSSTVSPTNTEFQKWLKEVLNEDAEILDELANR